MIVERFLTYLRAERRYSELTVRAYGDDIAEFSAFCLAESTRPRDLFSAPADAPAEFDFTLVAPDDIRAWIIALSDPKSRSGKPLKAVSVNRKLCSVRALFRWLRKEGLIEKDPFLRIGFLKTPKKLPEYIPESKMQRVVEGLENPPQEEDVIAMRNRLIVLMFYTTGMRLAELVGVNRGDFLPGFSELKVHGKGDKERIVPILVPVRRQIERYLQEINRENICKSGENSLFLTEKGDRIGRAEVYRVVREALGEAGIRGKRSPHVLRHTFATHLLNSGADMREIQELLGHASLQATQVYTHNSITQLKDAYRRAHPRSKKE